MLNDRPWSILSGDVRQVLATVPDGTARCCVTSPPYWGLRDYGVAAQLGLEATPDEYVANMVAVFREVRRVLADDGTLWLNLGDTYAAARGYQVPDSKHVDVGNNRRAQIPPGLKPKDMVGIPWRVALALQADGWWLRSDIVWCLSGGTWLYVRTDAGGICLMTVKDLYRLKPETVRLWNGREWTRLLGMSKSKRRGDELEITLRSGERIACTPTHRFPTAGGRVRAASELNVGDCLERVRLPEPTFHADSLEIGEDAAWLAGLYVAEGSRSGDTIQIAGHAKETHRWERLKRIAHKYGGSATRTVAGNRMDIRLYGKVLNGIIGQFVSGLTAHDKGFAPSVWRYSNNFIRSLLDGYLAGDGHRDEANRRWRLGFCRNYNLERDLRTACARLGYRLTLNLGTARYKGRRAPTFRGEIRTNPSDHHNAKDPNEIVAIGRARCRDVYDLGVADEPHVFALASGILTHNSKPNSMPESVTDRPTKSHEYLFLLAKSERYFYDAKAIAEPIAPASVARYDLAAGREGFAPSNGDYKESQGRGAARGDHADRLVLGGRRKELPETQSRLSARRDAERAANKQDASGDPRYVGFNARWAAIEPPPTRNARTVWSIPTQPYPEAHFATFPEELARRCIVAGSQVGDTVLDPFGGSGTTGAVAVREGRRALLVELNPAYIALAERRIADAAAQGNLFHAEGSC